VTLSEERPYVSTARTKAGIPKVRSGLPRTPRPRTDNIPRLLRSLATWLISVALAEAMK
jgi:hypothetical protein